MANETTEIEGLLDGTAKGVRKAFTDLGSASAAAKRAELLQDAIHGHGQRLIGTGDFDTAPRSGISAAEVVEANGPLSYHQWASGELGRVVAAGDEDEAELQDAIERAADAVMMLVAHGGEALKEDGGEDADVGRPASAEAPSPEPAVAVAEPAAAPYEAAPDPDPAPVPAAPEPRPEAPAPRAPRLSPASGAVDEAIESYEALAEAVMAKLSPEQGTQAELHVALIRAATSLTLDARAAAARKETLSAIPAAPAQPGPRETGGGRQGGGQQDRRRGQGRDGGRDGRDGRRDDRRDDRRGRGRDDFRGGRRDDRRDDRRGGERGRGGPGQRRP